MVDYYGRWSEEKDYSTYPEEKMCDYDRMAAWIREREYEPVTSMENLIDMIFLHCDGNDGEEEYDFSDLEDVKYYVDASGGLMEFDWEV